MTEQELARRFDLSLPAAAELAREVAAAEAQPRVVPGSERRRQISNIEDVAGSQRIEGYRLSEADKRFQAYAYSLGVSDDARTRLMRAYALARWASRALLPAE